MMWILVFIWKHAAKIWAHHISVLLLTPPPLLLIVDSCHEIYRSKITINQPTEPETQINVHSDG